jgi:UDP-GlcNAc:undecaprenyl-phosphate/decaprenyl-phosphate GlcNAc-1-phosphate transferase
MVLILALAFVSSMVLSLALTPAVMKLAVLVGALDYPNERKVHNSPMPRMGGVVIAAGFFLTFAMMLIFSPSVILGSWLGEAEGVSLIASLMLVLGLGIWDDIEPLRPSQKFIVQVLLATIIYLAGFRISSITIPFLQENISIGYLDYPLTIVWIVGITNAINLIDGLDGLASGVSTIAFLSVFPIALYNGDVATAAMSLIIAGSLIGFLRYNFNPARIFLGDSGSLFVGFALSVLTIHSSTKGSATFAVIVPILALGLPIMDTLLSMTRRLLRSFLPDEVKPESFLHKLASMFHPDKSHIHHRLIARGLSHRNAVLVLYGISALLGLGAFSVTLMNNAGASLVLAVVGFATVIGVRQLQYREMAVLQNGVLLPLYNRPIMNREALQVFFDVAFIIVSLAGAKYCAGWFFPTTEFGTRFITEASAAAIIQLGFFWFSGLYKGTFRLLGLGDVLRAVRAVAFAVVGTGIAFAAMGFPISKVEVVMFVLNFYFLATCVIGFRMSFRVLQYLSHSEMNGGKHVLLYGADSNGIVMLEKILESELANYLPVGFLDDDATLEGKTLNGYPIFGSHWKFASLIRTHHIDEVVLCGDSIKEESLRRLRATAIEHNIPIKRLRLLFEDYRPEAKLSPVGRSNAIVEPAAPAAHGDQDVADQLRQRLGGLKYRGAKSEFA